MPYPRHPRSSSLCMVAAALAAVLLLANCGGGGGTTPAPPSQSSQSVGTSLAVPDLGPISLAQAASAMPAGWSHGAFMEIYVRGYKDSNGDGKGDLQGLISKLDYLQDLGVRGIWLMPVTNSADKDHGYAVQNYRAIETDYGTMADFDQLLQQAHQRGIGVVIDYVINHSASAHPLFLNAASGGLNPQRNYYVWQNPQPTGWSVYNNNPWYGAVDGFYYAGFSPTMPDFNWKNSQVESFHQDNMRFWLNRGVDGMRFDAVGNLVENGPSAWLNQPENFGIMQRVQQVFQGYDHRYMVCEAPDAPQAFGASTACGGAFAFDLKDNLLNAARGQPAAIQAVSQYYVTAPSGMASILANHDLFAGDRIWNQLNGDVARYKMAAATYLLLPGTPFIYYGEEIGMAAGNGSNDDARLRTPMSWTADATGFSSGTPFRFLSGNIATQNVAAQLNQADSLHAFYKAMLGLRNSLPSIASGSYLAPFVSNAGLVMGFQRQLGSEQVLVLLNYSTSAQTVSVAALPAQASLVSQYGALPTTVVDGTGHASLTLGPQSVAVMEVQP